MPRPIPVSLRITDVERFVTDKKTLDAVVQVLGQTNWAGAKPVIAALAIIDQHICDLYNRCEKYWIQYLERGSQSLAGETPSVPGSPPSAGNPPAGSIPQGEV